MRDDDTTTLDTTGLADLFYNKDNRLGSGCSRDVFPLNVWMDNHEEEKVVKIATSSQGLRDNVMEYEFWRNNKRYEKVARWLAPCHVISTCGKYLIMSRTQKLTKAKTPKTLPSFITDIHRGNIGLYKGKVVTHDYARTQCTLDVKRKGVDFWDDETTS